MTEMPTRVNKYWLGQFFGATGFNMYDEDHPLGGLNMENLLSRIKLVEEYLRPEYESLSLAQKRAVKETMRYAINYFDDEELLYSVMYSVPDTQRNTREFYENIWRLLFGQESWKIEDASLYQRLDDRNFSLYAPVLRYGY